MKDNTINKVKSKLKVLVVGLLLFSIWMFISSYFAIYVNLIVGVILLIIGTEIIICWLAQENSGYFGVFFTILVSGMIVSYFFMDRIDPYNFGQFLVYFLIVGMLSYRDSKKHDRKYIKKIIGWFKNNKK